MAQPDPTLNSIRVAGVSGRDRVECEATASLIAAAPELYAALELVWEKVITECYNKYDYVWQQAEAALAKARRT